jgi:hypothetical protein
MRKWLERSTLPEVALPSSPKVSVGKEEAMKDDVLTAVYPHMTSNTAAVLDPVTKT